MNYEHNLFLNGSHIGYMYIKHNMNIKHFDNFLGYIYNYEIIL